MRTKGLKSIRTLVFWICCMAVLPIAAAETYTVDKAMPFNVPSGNNSCKIYEAVKPDTHVSVTISFTVDAGHVLKESYVASIPEGITAPPGDGQAHDSLTVDSPKAGLKEGVYSFAFAGICSHITTPGGKGNAPAPKDDPWSVTAELPVSTATCNHCELQTEDNPGFDKNKILTITPADPSVKYYEIDFLPDIFDSKNQAQIDLYVNKFREMALAKFAALPEVKKAGSQKDGIGLYVPGELVFSGVKPPETEGDPDNPFVCPVCKKRTWLKCRIGAKPPVSLSYTGYYIILPRWKQLEDYKSAYAIWNAWNAKSPLDKAKATPAEREAANRALATVKRLGQYYSLFKAVSAQIFDKIKAHEEGHVAVVKSYLTDVALALLWGLVGKRFIACSHDANIVAQMAAGAYNAASLGVTIKAFGDGINTAGDDWDVTTDYGTK